MSSELIKKGLVKTRLYDAAYNVLAPCLNRPYREKSINVLHDRQLIFIHNPKCAGTSVKQALGITAPGTADHRTPSYLVHPKTWEAYFSLVVVRNPFERLASSYAYHTSAAYKGHFNKRYPQLKELDIQAYFDLMVKEPTAIRPQVDYMRHRRSVERVGHVCRMERLAEDLQGVFQELGINEALPHKNRTTHPGYRDFFKDDDFLQRVQRYYQDDLDELGYEF